MDSSSSPDDTPRDYSETDQLSPLRKITNRANSVPTIQVGGKELLKHASGLSKVTAERFLHPPPTLECASTQTTAEDTAEDVKLQPKTQPKDTAEDVSDGNDIRRPVSPTPPIKKKKKRHATSATTVDIEQQPKTTALDMERELDDLEIDESPTTTGDSDSQLDDYNNSSNSLRSCLKKSSSVDKSDSTSLEVGPYAHTKGTKDEQDALIAKLGPCARNTAVQ